MKYYLATIDGYRKLFPWEKDIPKGVKAQEIDIPTDKEGLLSAIQELLTEADEAAKKVPVDPEVSRPLKPSGIDSDGFPRVRTAYTHAQVGAMFNKIPEHVRDICYAISKLDGLNLGHVAFQVAAQITKKITITEGGHDG